MFEAMTDAQLCRASREDQTEAFTELVRRYQAAVCAVTYAATGRQDLSEDLAQETFLIAWKKLHGIEAPDRVAGWLVGIARNLARRTRIEDRNRPITEHEAADGQLGVEEAAVERETRSRVWELLGTLPSRYREVMVLYYREGKSAPRVAEQLGISLSAAEQRLSRGRRLLRDKFERVVEDELARTRPTSALTRRVAAALPIGAWPTAGAVPLLAKVVVMKKLVAIAVAIVAVLLAGYVAFDRSRPDPDVAPLAEPSDVRATPATAFATDDRSTKIEGTVIDADDGTPQPSAVVTISRPDGSAATLAADDGTQGPAIGRTTEDGTFTIEGLAPGRYVATATADGKSSSEPVAFVVEPEQRVDGLLVRIGGGGVPIDGIVSDLGGGPIAGATVRAHRDGGWFVATVTDEDGRYRLSLPRGRHVVSVWDPDYEAVEEWLSVRGPQHVVDFEMVPAGTITGRVVRRDDGEPVPGAVISFERFVRLPGGFQSDDSADDQTAVADAEGRFTLRRLKPAEYRLIARADGWSSRAPAEVVIGIAEQVTDVVVPVDPAFTVRGRVVDAGDPKLGIADARVSTLSSMAMTPAFTRTSADGTFELVGLQPGSYALSVEAAAMIPASMETKVAIVDADVEGLEVGLERGLEVRGRVVPPGIADVELGLLRTVGGMEVMFEGRKIRRARTRSDQRGEFVIPSAPRGTWNVRATAMDGSKGEVEITVGDSTVDAVEVRLQPRPAIRGTLTNAAGDPVRDARLRLVPDRGTDKRPGGFASFGGEQTTDVDGLGGFEFVGLEPGRYRLTANSRGGQVLPRVGRASDDPGWVVDVPSSGTELALIVETPSGVISGTVLDADGAGVPDVYVTLQPGEADVFSEERSVVLSDASGRFRFERLSEGTYGLHARSQRGDAKAEQLGVRAGDRVGLVLEELGSIEGRVTAGGRPIEQFSVGTGLPRTFVSAEGRFELGRIEAGHHTVVVTAEQGSATVSVQVRPGEPTRVDVELGAWATLRGRAVWPDGRPAAGLSIAVDARGRERDRGDRLVGELTGRDRLVTDAEGRFEIGGIGAGRGTLSFADGGIRRRGRAHGGAVFHVDAGQTEDLGDIVLLAPGEPSDAPKGDLGLSVEAAYDAPVPLDGSRPESLGAPSGPAGLWISHVDPSGPASDLGLERGQRIVAFDDQSIDAIGAVNAEELFDDDRVEKGRRYRLVIETGEGERTVDIVAAPSRFGS